MDQADYVLIGKVSKTHGIKGEIKIYLYSGDPDELQVYPELLLSEPETDAMDTALASAGDVLYEVIRSRNQGKTALVQLQGVVTMEASEDLVGKDVWVAKKLLPDLEPDQFYWHELIGLRVITDDGADIGVITSLLATGGHDVLVVTGKGREYLIPANKEFIVEIDYQAEVIVIAPPPGLLTIND